MKLLHTVQGLYAKDAPGSSRLPIVAIVAVLLILSLLAVGAPFLVSLAQDLPGRGGMVPAAAGLPNPEEGPETATGPTSMPAATPVEPVVAPAESAVTPVEPDVTPVEPDVLPEDERIVGPADEQAAPALATTVACQARNARTGSTYTSIQAAVNAASDNDLIQAMGECNASNSEGSETQILYIPASLQGLVIEGGYVSGSWVHGDPIANPAILNGHDEHRVVFVATGAQVELRDLYMINGKADDASSLTHPNGHDGGGIHNSGILKVVNCDIANSENGNRWEGIIHTGDRGNGGGIYSSGTLELLYTTIRSNYSYGNGGGVYIAAGSVTIKHSTISANHANHSTGGAISIANGSLDLRQSTLTGNTGDTNVAAVYVNPDADVTLSGNIIAQNVANRPDCEGSFASGGYNFIGSSQNSSATRCTLSGGTGDRIGTTAAPLNPLLGGLAANGGVGKTQLPLGR